MKHGFAAAAAAPLLMACASAGAQTAAEAEDTQTAVLLINGETIALDAGRDAAAAIEQALADSHGSGRFVFEFDAGSDSAWDAADRAEFAREMAEMAASLEQAFRSEFDFDFDFDFAFDGDAVAWSHGDGERLHVMMRRAAREAERHAAPVERRAERLERQAERAAVRMERHAAQAELHGLRAGVSGMQDGLESINEVLERGWYYDWGERERVTLSDERRAELEDARAELVEGLERLRAHLAEAEARYAGAGHREVRIVRRDGRARGFVNGEEVTGSELDQLLEGAPDTPEPPHAPDER